ncbi:zinc ABC transporter substrate-binding protein [Clostridium sp. MB40-C1]|uniref:metal ABC transporter solute-binding protein, Zn/Mn family n=1 Tax=Clostridium sp. MB40-C1 TaxID=3070996 RepID=UPI0027E17F7A|nr:zinc ABC transporter substrate-binding protein [Clostridium sp. MB40-C1]WMJ79631.1 zinc ABC transporter substrate-binding protein [Clostridium sp. MB40-C1]
MKKHIKFILLASFIVSCNILIGCSKNATTSNVEKNNKIPISVSIVPQETFVKAVGKNLVDVVTMIPSGQSPENFQPTPDLLEKFSKSKLYFSIGVPTEKTSIIPKASDLNPNIKIINLEKVVQSHYPDREFSPGMRDPHIWLSPKRVKVMIDSIKDELCKIDPPNKSFYEKNAKDYINNLNKIDKDIHSSLSHLKNKAIIVYHPAFGYFCDDYGLEMIPLEKDGKESTVQDLQQSITYAKEKHIKVIFYQAEVDSKQSKTFADEIGGRSELVEPLSADYIKNLQTMCDTFKKALE